MADPVLVQHICTPSTLANKHQELNINLPNPSLAGNLLIVSVTWDAFGDYTVSCTDDQEQTYASVKSDGTSQDAQIFYVINTLAGVKKITLTWNSSEANWQSVAAAEFYNVATSTPDVDSAVNEGSASTSWQATGTVADNASAETPYLVYQIGFGEGTTAQASFAAGSGFTLLCTNRPGSLGEFGGKGSTAYAAQFRVVTSSLTNPIITAGTSQAYNTIAIAFKSASAGAAPTITPRVVRVQYNNTDDENSPLGLQFPCQGSLQVAIVMGNSEANSLTVSAITDSQTNDWNEIENSPVVNGNSGTRQMWYCAGGTPSLALTLSLTFTVSIMMGNCICLMDIVGANRYLDGFSNTGTKATTGNLTAITVTPTATGQLIVCDNDFGWGTDFDTVTDANGHKPEFLNAYWTAENGDAIGYFEHDSGQATYVTDDLDDVTFIFNRGSSDAPDDWNALAAIFGPDTSSIEANLPIDTLNGGKVQFG